MAIESANLEKLKRTGELVFGKAWQTPMAGYVHVDKRTINRWKQKQWPVPDIVPDGRTLDQAMQDLVEKHKEDILKLESMLSKGKMDGGD